MFTRKLLPAALAAVSHVVFAAAPVVGNQSQQIPVIPQPQASGQSATPVIRLVPASALPETSAVNEAPFMVQSLLIVDATVLSQEALRDAADFEPGMMTLTQLRAAAARMADAYHAAGYVLAQAYLPAQEIHDGVVTIKVQEGRYGRIDVRNTTRVAGGTISTLMDGLHSGAAVAIDPLESRLLLLSDLPGVVVKSSLGPGAIPGTSDLVVDVTPGATVSGSVDADNAGNRYTGENRLGATINVSELLGLGDVASLRVLTSLDGLNYVRGAYQLQAGKARVGVAFSRLGYRLGDEFAALHARGVSTDATLFGSYPLLRSRHANLTAQLALDDKRYRDRASDTLRSDKAVRMATGSLYGDFSDRLGHGASNTALVSVGTGTLNLQSDDARAADSLTARSNGHFTKMNFAASRVQGVTDRVSLFAGVNGQLASKNLDVSEKIELGGVNAVRAYPEGETFADAGIVANLEVRYLLPLAPARFNGQAQVFAFVDAGHVTINQTAWDPTPNHRTLRGAGVGTRLYENNHYLLTAVYAHKLGSTPAQSAPDRSGRLWLQIVKYF